MPQRISKKTLYLNADRSKVVAEDDPDAAFLFVRAGSAVNEHEAARLEKDGVKLNLSTDDHEVPSARELHEAQYNPATEEPKAPADAKAAEPKANKAVAKAPANKAKE